MKKQRRLLIVLYYYHPYVSGVSVYVKRLAEALAGRGYHVTVLTSQFEKNLPRKETINGVHIVREPVLFRLDKGVIMPLFWLKAAALARENDIVNFHLPMAESNLSSLFIPKEKLFTTYHCDLSLGSSIVQKIITWISLGSMKQTIARSTRVIPSSQDYFSHSLMKEFSDKSFPIYPVIDETAFQPTNYKNLQKKLGVEQSKHKIGFVGRIVSEKGIKYLLESIQYLEPLYPDLKVIIVGDYEKVAGGSVKASLDHYLEQYPDKIIFTGYISDDELKELFSMIDVFVLPSVDPLEAFGMVQVEAMLCGTPVLSTNRPGQREIIRRSGYGLLFKPRDPKDIAKTVQKFFEKPSHYTPVRKRVVELFGLDATVNKYIFLFEGQKQTKKTR